MNLGSGKGLVMTLRKNSVVNACAAAERLRQVQLSTLTILSQSENSGTFDSIPQIYKFYVTTATWGKVAVTKQIGGQDDSHIY